jgi:ATP-dependent Clp protease protease subunit
MTAKIFAFRNTYKKGLVIENKANSNVAEIILYGAIGANPWDESSISAKQFSEELKKIPSNVTEIHLRINSPGGSVFDGMTMYERLKQHKAKVITYVDGYAASIASVIALAGDEIRMGEGSFFMIHKPLTMTWGNADEHDRTIAILDKIEEQMISIYAKKSGLSRAEIANLLREETYFNAEETLKHGFADQIIDVGDRVSAVASMFKGNPLLKNAPEIKSTIEKQKLIEMKDKINKFLAR